VFTSYRLKYLVVVVVVAVMSGAAAIAAAARDAQTESAPAANAPSDYEKGNLSEAGARELMTISDYTRAVAISKSKPVLVFKHSTECEVSAAAYRRVAAWAKAKGRQAPGLFLVKVIERRPLSQEIAALTEITHESPQAILFADGKPVWNASHEAVTGDAIDTALLSVAKSAKETN